jgi:hypothetical protein
MQPRDDEKREPQITPESSREEQPRLKRFRIIKVEERIAPQASGSGYEGRSTPTRYSCPR